MNRKQEKRFWSADQKRFVYSLTAPHLRVRLFYIISISIVLFKEIFSCVICFVFSFYPISLGIIFHKIKYFICCMIIIKNSILYPLIQRLSDILISTIYEIPFFSYYTLPYYVLLFRRRFLTAATSESSVSAYIVVDVIFR